MLSSLSFFVVSVFIFNLSSTASAYEVNYDTLNSPFGSQPIDLDFGLFPDEPLSSNTSGLSVDDHHLPRCSEEDKLRSSFGLLPHGGY